MRQDFRLGRWIVQPSLNRLLAAADSRDDGETRPLGHKVMAVLLCLAARPGEAVTKEELFERAWDGAFTTDEALSTAVYELRRALGDDAREPRYVETIRKRGYRLIAPVSELAGEAPTGPLAAGSVVGGRRPVSRRALAVAALVGAACTVLAVLGAGWLGFSDSAEAGFSTPPAEAPPVETPPTEPRVIRSVAIPPLASFSDECRQDFFAGGLTEMLIADLAYLGPLDVIPIPGADDVLAPGDPRQTAGLRADAVIEGTVLHSGDRLWISIQLVDSTGGQILWGGTYERDLSESLDLQLELSREISHQIVSSVAPLEVSAASP